MTVTPVNSSPMVETAQNVKWQVEHQPYWLGSMGGGISVGRVNEFDKGDWKIADPDDNANRYVTSGSVPRFAQWTWLDPVALRLDTIPAGVTATRIVASADPFTPKESTPMRAGVSYPLVDGVTYRIVAKDSVATLPFNLQHHQKKQQPSR